MIRSLAKNIIILPLLALGSIAVSGQTNIYPWPASGYIGIGIAGPSTFLHVVGDTSSNGVRLVRLESPATDTGITFKNTSSSGRNYSLFSSGSGSGIGGGLFSIVDDTAGAVRLTVSGSGNVGIGTTTPAARLEVLGTTFGQPATSGSNQPSSSVRIGNAQTNGVLDIGINSGSGAWLQYTHRQDLSQVYPLLLNPNGGNVGVGTLSPGARLEVSGTTMGLPATSGINQPNASLRLGNAQTNGVLDMGINSGGGAWLQYTHRQDLSQAYPLILNPNGGNVGIGTTNPTQKLSVNGTIRAKEVIVETAGWSDYVFADNYTLQPLAEVAEHIKEHKHLPGIPSAKEVAEGGISLGEMQAKLLAKIEELTLHQIEQEKQLTEQKRLIIEQAKIIEVQAGRVQKLENQDRRAVGAN